MLVNLLQVFPWRIARMLLNARFVLLQDGPENGPDDWQVLCRWKWISYQFLLLLFQVDFSIILLLFEISFFNILNSFISPVYPSSPGQAYLLPSLRVSRP